MEEEGSSSTSVLKCLTGGLPILEGMIVLGTAMWTLRHRCTNVCRKRALADTVLRISSGIRSWEERGKPWVFSSPPSVWLLSVARIENTVVISGPLPACGEGVPRDSDRMAVQSKSLYFPLIYIPNYSYWLTYICRTRVWISAVNNWISQTLREMLCGERLAGELLVLGLGQANL